MKYEYRVTWRREGSTGKARRIYETAAAAERCVRRQATAHDDLAGWEIPDPPKPLVWGPVVERREVGPWVIPPGQRASDQAS